MQPNRSAGDPVPSGTVQGLGVSDVLRLELRAVQVPWLIEEIEDRRGPLEEAVQRARDAPDSEATRDELESLQYELRLHRLMRARLPCVDRGEDVVFVGPTRLVLPLVEGTMHHVIEILLDVATHRYTNDSGSRDCLRKTAAAAIAWIATFLDMKEVEAFSFDPDADPVDFK